MQPFVGISIFPIVTNCEKFTGRKKENVDVREDKWFTIHYGLPKKGSSENGEESRHKHVFNFQSNQVCSACFLGFFRINPN